MSKEETRQRSLKLNAAPPFQLLRHGGKLLLLPLMGFEISLFERHLPLVSFCSHCPNHSLAEYKCKSA